MTTSGRFSRRLAAGCVFASGLAAGCANSSQFTAGRLPYGGARTASAAASTQDPFATQAAGGGVLTAPGAANGAFAAGAVAHDMPGGVPSMTGGPGPGGFAPAAGAARPGANPYETAYLPQAADGGFAPMSSEMPSADATGEAEWAGFETAAPAESNPFAEVEGQPAVSGPASAQRVAAEPMPRITPAGASGDPWQPREDATASFAGEEFLPPVQ